MNKEAMKQALEALEINFIFLRNVKPAKGQEDLAEDCIALTDEIITALKEALAQPEFTKHEVENADGWSEWVCPDPKSYLFKCCDCGLVHEAEFGVVRYKSETDREDCDMVDDPNLQAVFRMRRSEQWSPADMAHRAGGLTMEQLAQQEPVGEVLNERGEVDWFSFVPTSGTSLYLRSQAREPLTDEEIRDALEAEFLHSDGKRNWQDDLRVVRAIEAALRSKNI